MRHSHEVILKTDSCNQAGLRDSLLMLFKEQISDSTHSWTHKEQLIQTLGFASGAMDDKGFQERTKELLDMEFSKIQNEYEVLNLWCALLTVVFLIFSFFSIFKTTEMSRQGEEALTSLRTTAIEAKQKSASIDDKVTDAETRINQKEKELIDNVSEQINDLSSNLNTQKKSLDEMNKKIQDNENILDKISTEKDQALKEITETVKQEVTSLSERITEAVDREIKVKSQKYVDSHNEIVNEVKSINDTIIRILAQIEISDNSVSSQNGNVMDLDDEDSIEIEEE